jgi:hypothetical protein
MTDCLILKQDEEILLPRIQELLDSLQDLNDMDASLVLSCALMSHLLVVNNSDVIGPTVNYLNNGLVDHFKTLMGTNGTCH